MTTPLSHPPASTRSMSRSHVAERARLPRFALVQWLGLATALVAAAMLALA